MKKKIQQNNNYSIELDHVTCSIDHNVLCENVSFTMSPGDNLTIFWKDGLGKSTFMEIVSGLSHTKYQGIVKHYGKNVKAYVKDVAMKLRYKNGFVFQNSALISNHNVFENIALPLRYHSKKSNREIDRIVNDFIAAYEIEHIQYLLPEMLSTSQAKIVAFARALVVQPDILFLDEPSLGLDHESFDLIVDQIKTFSKQKHTITLMMTKSLTMCNAVQFPFAVFINKKLTLPK